MLSLLRIAAIISSIFAFVSLFIQVLKTRNYGRKSLYSIPQGRLRNGLFYAFGKGMLPWEKESTRNHLPSYLAGIVYHLAIFSALLYFFSLILSFKINIHFIFLLRILLFSGFICGLGLLFKRIIIPELRWMSVADDFASNILVDLFLLNSLIESLIEGWRAFFFISSILMFIYIPLGKIRHCFFFFLARIHFGLFYGRRAVLVPWKKRVS